MSRLLLGLALLATAAGSAQAPLRVKASPAVAPCVTAAAAAYERATGRRLVVETAALFDAASTDGADVVVAADQELNRIIEGGATHPDLDLDVAQIPWVLAGAPGTAAAGSSAQAPRAGPRACGSWAGRSGARRRAAWPARASAPHRVARLARAAHAAAARRRRGRRRAPEPRGLAPGADASTSRRSPRARSASARARAPTRSARSSTSCAGEKGNAAFRACGRTEAR